MMVAGHQTMLAPPALPYDAEVEYIESTGTQYVDTGIVPDSHTGLELLADEPTYSVFGDFYVAGLRNGSGDTRWCIGCSTSSQWYFGYGAFRASNVGGSPAKTSLNYLDDKKFLVGTSYSYDLPSLSFVPAYAIRLFGSAGVVATYSIAPVKIYSAKVSQGASNVRDYIPVRVGSGSSAVGYLYDRANPTGGPLGNGLYGSATSTPLIAGQDK